VNVHETIWRDGRAIFGIQPASALCSLGKNILIGMLVNDYESMNYVNVRFIFDCTELPLLVLP